MKHTPGPWGYSDDLNRVSGTPGFSIGVAGYEIAEITHSENESAKHDAALIAAAPEMLEALKYAETFIETARQYFPKSIKNDDKFKLENTCAAIGKAIAKAEGRL